MPPRPPERLLRNSHDVGLSRRDFFQLVGASLALSAGCHPPHEAVYEYSRQPVELTPGVPLHYATTMALHGRSAGLLVASSEGRPTKVEGNPDHPENRGAASAWEQAAVRELYDPDRAHLFKKSGVPLGPQSFYSAVAAAAERHRSDRGAGLAFLLEPTSSPTLGGLVARIRSAFPLAKIHFYSSVSEHESWEGARLAFGRPLETVYDFKNADVILSLDADFLALMPGSLRYARAFADRRVPENGMSRLYVVESNLSSTGHMADHRLRARTGDIAAIALCLLKQIASMRGAAEAALAPIKQTLSALSSSWEAEPFLQAAARDLASHPGRALVVAGARQPAVVSAIAHAINTALFGQGKTSLQYPPVLSDIATGPLSVRDLVSEINAGQIRTLFIDAWNPVYTAPADAGLSDALHRVESSFYLGPYEDETSKEVVYFAPAAHFLESWGDARFTDGTVCLAQPLIAPIFGGITSLDMLASLFPPPGPESGNESVLSQDPLYRNPSTVTPPTIPEEGPSPIEQQSYVPSKSARRRNLGAYELMLEFYRSQHPGPAFDAFWEASLQRGVVDGSATAPVTVSLSFSTLAPALSSAISDLPKTGAAGDLEIGFYPDAHVYDGRFANNPWLQEFPDPMTKLTWDNAALLSPRTAKELHVATGDLLELAFDGRTMRAAALILPGHADQSVSLTLGYGRTGEESVGAGQGFNAGQIRTTGAFFFGSGLKAKKVPGSYLLAFEQEQSSMEERPIAISATLGELEKSPGLMDEWKEAQPSIWPQLGYTGHKWGMGIDLSRCVGCGACVVACMAENNVPPVGKEQVAKGRIMIWLRLDRYFLASKKDAENPGVIVQPLFCVHCENAPCEYVCPVNATVHSGEGLNLMVYNRCVGTRYCSNNCPYKVRRFNYLSWNKAREAEPLVRMLKNPDVTVRERGVMEKCTYCVQRIERARIDRRRNFEEIKDGDIVTACQQTCPAQAIVFGDLNDAGSGAARMHKDPRSYRLLSQLGTRPRSAHLIRIKNPNPELA